MGPDIGQPLKTLIRHHRCQWDSHKQTSQDISNLLSFFEIG